MADFDMKSDEEKAEALKAWWRSNGTSVVAGVALTIGGMFGWNYYQENQLTSAEGASKIYSQLYKDDADPAAIVEKLNSEYGSSVYTSLAALTAAKNSCEDNKTDACIDLLKSATESSQDSISIIAKIRLARTLISTGKLDEAKSIISTSMPKSYESLISELNGDIHYAKKEFKLAREAYDKAIETAGSVNTQLLQMKRDDLGDHLKTGA
ncbi:MAG: tetratricopeptide repeat protein [Cocleimonas sp.]